MNLSKQRRVTSHTSNHHKYTVECCLKSALGIHRVPYDITGNIMAPPVNTRRKTRYIFISSLLSSSSKAQPSSAQNPPKGITHIRTKAQSRHGGPISIPPPVLRTKRTKAPKRMIYSKTFEFCIRMWHRNVIATDIFWLYGAIRSDINTVGAFS